MSSISVIWPPWTLELVTLERETLKRPTAHRSKGNTNIKKQINKLHGYNMLKSQNEVRLYVRHYLCAISLRVPGYHYSVFSTVFTQRCVLRIESKKKAASDWLIDFTPRKNKARSDNKREQLLIKYTVKHGGGGGDADGSGRGAKGMDLEHDYRWRNTQGERRPQTLKWEAWALTGVGVCASE